MAERGHALPPFKAAAASVEGGEIELEVLTGTAVHAATGP